MPLRRLLFLLQGGLSCSVAAAAAAWPAALLSCQLSCLQVVLQCRICDRRHCRRSE